MKILIASDSFKHSLSSQEVGEYLKKGIKKVSPKWEVNISPVADGGEGTMESIVSAMQGRKVIKEVHDPLMRKRNASFGLVDGGKTAIIEMASASGIELLEEHELDPWRTTTYGTGELMKAALDEGCEKIIVGMGGSSTNDGGTGMLRALGVRFLDLDGRELSHGGGALCELHEIITAGMDDRLKDRNIIAATDVDNILLGDKGASLVYGPQKGADANTSEKLDGCLRRYADKVSAFTGEDHSGEKGTGAAGGLGFGMRAFLGAEIRHGFDVVTELTGLEGLIRAHDLVITGEGKIDNQTQYGKAPMGVCRLALKAGKPVIAVGGTLGEGYDELYNKGFHLILPLPDRPMSLSESIKNAPSLLEKLGERIARMLVFRC